MIFLRKFIKKHYFAFSGILIGAANGLFGGGGGMIAVPMLEKGGLEQKKAHATSIAVTLALSVVSAGVYLFKGSLEISDALKYVPMGLLGAGAGAWLLKKIPDKGLKKIFALVMILSGVRILLRRG